MTYDIFNSQRENCEPDVHIIQNKITDVYSFLDDSLGRNEIY